LEDANVFLRITLVFLVAALVHLPAWTQEPATKAVGVKGDLIPRKVLFGNPDKTSPKLSPDGAQLAFLAPVDGVMNVWVAPLNDLASAKAVTQDTKRGIRSFQWAYTNQHILYEQDAGGDEDFHLYGVELASKTTKDLTPLKKIRVMVLASSPEFAEELLIGLNDRDPRFHDVYRLNIKSGERKLLEKNTEFIGFVPDHNYHLRFANKFTKDGGMAFYEPDGKDGWKEAFTIPQADSLTTQLVGFNKSNDVAYMLDSRGRDAAAFSTLDLKTGKQTVVAEDPRSDASGVLIHPTTYTVEGVSFTFERTRWKFLDDGVAQDFERLKKVADGDINIVSRTLDDKAWVVAYLMDNGPVRYYLFDRVSKQTRFLFSNRAALEGLPLARMHPHVLQSRDGHNLVCYLTLPPGQEVEGKGLSKQPLPMVLLVHGGPWARDSWGFEPQHQLLANRGYAVLSINFRGSAGFGKRFLNAGNREWAGKMHDDLLDAVKWAIDNKIAQKDKVAIMGGSYGGYATLVGMTFTPETFACGVDIVGPSNLVTLLNSIPAYWGPMVQIFKDRVGDHTTEDGKKELMTRSPLAKVDQIRRPLLVAQGANDPRVKQAEADQIVEAMQKHKIPVTYVLYSDEGHGFARPENRLSFYAVTEAFLAQHLGGRYEPIGDAFLGSSITVPAGASDVPGLPDALKKLK
jgi:dipeptidyl aminopeptidase/acylaminoacyl peptidase